MPRFAAVNVGAKTWMLGLSLLATACIGPSTDATTAEEELCLRAEEHVESCTLDGAGLFPDGCDAEVARDLMAIDCNALRDPGKSDIAGRVLCRVGLLRHCEVPHCDGGLPIDVDFSAMDCRELIGSGGCAECDFYRCREAQSIGVCDVDGYYLGFGYKYCRRYQQVTEPRMSERGQAWSAQTRECLMWSLHENVADTPLCSALVEEGYDSHPDCYLGTGFCELTPGDWLKVLNTIDPSDLDFSLMLETGTDCISR